MLQWEREPHRGAGVVVFVVMALIAIAVAAPVHAAEM